MSTIVLEHLQHANSASPDLTVDSSGRIGIGTTTPATSLNVVSSSYPYVRITNTGYTGFDIGQADASEGGNALVKLRDSANMDFYTADLNRMRISSTGNVGIGTITSDPATKLDIDATSAGASGDGITIRNATSGDSSAGIYIKRGSTTATAIYTNPAFSNLNTTILSDGSINFRTNNANRVEIDTSGRITAPYQPSFMAHKTSHLAISGSGQVEAGSWATNYVSGGHNIGGHFNTSNGRFTAPIAGRYKFDANIMHGITSGDYQIWLCVNGNQSNMVRSNSMQSTGGNWKQTTVTGIFNLAANDYISIFVRSSASETYAMYGSSTSAFTTCNGYLIG